MTTGLAGQKSTEAGARWSGAAPEVLAEREEQLDRLGGRLNELQHGRSGMVTVLGEPGTGRSALLRAVVARAKEAALPAVLARCSPAEADLRYGVVSQIASGLAGAGYPAFSRRLWAEGRQALIPVLCGELAALARKQPLLIALDDAQWADAESKAWLAAMASRLRYVPVLLVQVAGQESTSVVRVPPLSERGVRQVIVSRYAGPVDEAFVTAATEATGGSPAALSAILDQFELPPIARYVPVLRELAGRVRGDRMAASLACLPADALALLRVMAVGECGLGFGLLTALAPPSAISPEQALSVLVRLGLVTGGEYPHPVSPLVADLALAGMSVGERQTLARRAVELGHRAVIPEDRLARLLLNAPPVGAGWVVNLPGVDAGWVVNLLRRVAGRRRLDGDYEGAAALLGRALREPVGGEQRQRLIIELAMSEVGHSPAASDRRFQQVLLNSGPEVPVSVLVQAADLLNARGDAPATLRAVAAACARHEGGGTDVGPLAAIGWLADNDCMADAGLPVRSFPNPSDRSADPVVAGIAAWRLAARGRSRSRSRELARAALQFKGEDQPFGPRIHAARALHMADDVAEAVIGLDEVLADARRCGAPVPAALALLQRSRCEMQRGNLGQAVCDFEAAKAELSLNSWHPRVLPSFVALEACLHLAGRSVEEAAQVLARRLPAGAEQGAAWAMLLFARASVHLELADQEAALREIDECGRVLLAKGWTNPALLPWRSVAAAANSACGNGEAARRLAMDAVERARTWGAPSTLGSAHLSAARVLSGAEATGELESAVRVLKDSVSRDSYARARRLLEEAGSTPPINATLTAQEERIAALAAAGRSNAAIASVLSVSLRTVELRLTGIYRKLAITGRHELASRLPPIPAARNVGG
ncbi:DNA-binding CsgD family transcriptional regulator [Streptosporangium album]|uniref:DNA-binding CsgD family transcriptional regulator n=1 Tax=Streptosporangium album TaxID=47479 RepID=A0A7W7WCJ9_9ACTN|nr:LuxR family transcriptional regulator [Streptosporangium album]MBB4942687.1 DNA-binding CsgD family transcriptional regulator [Streptosporangium album]